MTQIEEKEAIKHLQTAFNAFAPDADVQVRLYHMLRDMQAWSADNKSIAIAICAALIDGLRHGNW